MSPDELSETVGRLVALPIFRLMLACVILGAATLLVLNLLRRRKPYLFRVAASVGLAYFLASPSLAVQLGGPDRYPPASGCVLAFAVSLTLVWFCIFRPGAVEELQQIRPPSNRFLW